MARITKSVEERRQEIIAAARELFVENGFDKTQMADISKKMHVAQGLVYHYFKSKTDILYAVIDIITEEQAAATRKMLAEMQTSTLDGLSFLFREPPHLHSYGKLIPSLLADSAIIDYCAKKLTVAALPQVTALIERGNADGSWNCENPEVTAAFILHGVSGVMGSSVPACRDDGKQKAIAGVIFRVLGLSDENYLKWVASLQT